MKRHLNLFNSSLLGIGAILFSSCGSEAQNSQQSSDQQTEQLETAKLYHCPMKCEGEKVTYKREGKCGVCEMDLVEIASK